jgi:anti-sigma factor RsiW
MNDQHSREAPHLTCDECRGHLQDYLDGGLAKPDSMRVFLHVRDCAGCAEELARLEELVAMLEALPAREAPADFDARVLAAVPYESYRAMANLRRARVPVFLEQESLPAWVRSRAVRLVGAGVAAVAIAARLAGLLPDTAVTVVVAAVGLAPEITLALQGTARRLVLALGHGGERS